MSFKHLEEGFFCYSVLLSQNIFIHLNISNKQIYIYIVYFRLILASNDILENRVRLCVPDELHSRRDGRAYHLAKMFGSTGWNANGTRGSTGNFLEQAGGRPLEVFTFSEWKNGTEITRYHSHKISNSAVRTGRKHQLFWPKIFRHFALEIIRAAVDFAVLKLPFLVY